MNLTHFKNRLFQKLCAFIPNHISNNTVVNVLNSMRKIERLLKRDFSGHLPINESAFFNHIDSIEKSNGFIEDQNNYTDMLYGKATMQYAGCEIFATYNAIFSLLGKNRLSLPQMILAYEKDGMVLTGRFGTSPKAIYDFLRKEGFTAEFTTKENDFESLGRRSQSLILTIYNDRDDISKEIHTVNISKEDNGYTAHNVYCNGRIVGPYESLSELTAHMNGGRVKGIALIGIYRCADPKSRD